MSEPFETSILRRVDEEVVEGMYLMTLSLTQCSHLPPTVLSVFVCVEAEEVISSLRIDRGQMSNTWNKALAIAVHSSPVQQFGIGFGVGW